MMEHQWFCGGKDPCACMDSWKEAELEKEIAAKDAAQVEWDFIRRMVKAGEAGEAGEAGFRPRPESNVGKAISDDPGPSSVPPFGPLPCVHEWAFLRTRTEYAYIDSLGKRIEKVDVFFCRRCLTYREMEG